MIKNGPKACTNHRKNLMPRITPRLVVCLAATALVSACAMPEENTLNRADYRAAEADDAFARTLPFTDVADIPGGNATYDGHLRSEAIVNGQGNFKVLGDLSLGVDIAATGTRAGTGEVTGQITNINLFDDAEDGFDDQALTGDLTISGSTEGGRIDATATGVVGAVLADGPTGQDATWSVDLNGDFRSNFENADVVAGSATGGTLGSASDQYDLLLSGGRFYGERR